MKADTYLPNLNTIRFYAACCVVLGHISEWTGLTLHLPLILPASYAVTLFFVLSGFLITHKLILEKETTGTIQAKRFILRRGKRIWPLAYLILGLSALALPFVPLEHQQAIERLGISDWVAVLLLSVQIPHAFHSLFYLGHYWSIGVEEWFYAVWPVALKKYSVFAVIVGVIIGYGLIGILYFPKALSASPFEQGLQSLYSMCRFDCMAFGALMAWTLHYAPHLKRVIFKLELPISFLLLFIILVCTYQSGTGFEAVFAYLFSLWVLNLAANPKSCWRWLEHPLPSYLGQISYGIYLWHPLVIVLTISLFSGLSDVLHVLAVLVLTLLVSHLSYQGFERHFLASSPPTPSQLPLELSGTD